MKRLTDHQIDLTKILCQLVDSFRTKTFLLSLKTRTAAAARRGTQMKPANERNSKATPTQTIERSIQTIYIRETRSGRRRRGAKGLKHSVRRTPSFPAAEKRGRSSPIVVTIWLRDAPNAIHLLFLRYTMYLAFEYRNIYAYIIVLYNTQNGLKAVDFE